MKTWVVVAVLGAAVCAQAQTGRVLRVATVAPEGSHWARAFVHLMDDVAMATKGNLRVRMLFGGIAGDEDEMTQRLRKGQLDGVVSGGVICQDIMPSMRIFTFPGLIQSREEAAWLSHQLRPSLMTEARASGYELLATSGLGPVIVFSRTPIRGMAELRKAKLWHWRVERSGLIGYREQGIPIAPADVYDAAELYRSGKVDGFLAVPAAALVFQWSTQAKYYTDIRTGYLNGCMLISRSVFDSLSGEDKRALMEAAAKVDVRIEEAARAQDDRLLGGLFEKQGLIKVPVSESFQSEFMEAARVARRKLGELGVARDVLNRVLEQLADYRAEHARRR